MIPVVIMAGGKGTRMGLYTSILPKPLIPVGDKTMLETIIEEFGKSGVNTFYFTLNYKGQMIKSYFESIEKDYDLIYVDEKEFNGTAGSLKYLENEGYDNLLVSNCDVVIKADYADLVKMHKESDSYLTIVSAIQQYKIPYGVIEFDYTGGVIGIKEKPQFTFNINSGVYVVNYKCLDYIPKDKLFNMTDLIKALIVDGKKVTTYSVGEKDYIDVGQWEEYQNNVDKLTIKRS